MISVEEKIRELEQRILILEEKARRKVKEKDPALKAVKDTFLSAFEKKFGHGYAGWGPKEYGMAANWLKSVPLERALEYCAVYPSWKQKRVVEAGHPFTLLVMRHVELDAHMRRYPEHIKNIIESRAREKIEIEDKVDDYESRVRADLHAAEERSNSQLAHSGQVQIQDGAKPELSGPRFEPT